LWWYDIEQKSFLFFIVFDDESRGEKGLFLRKFYNVFQNKNLYILTVLGLGEEVGGVLGLGGGI